MKSVLKAMGIIMLLLFSLAASTQTGWIDSAKKAVVTQKEDTNKIWALRNISYYYSFNDPDSGILYAKQALALAEKLKFDKGIFWSIQSLDHSLYITGNYTLELDYALRAFPLAKKLNDNYALGWSNGMLADSYLNLGDYNAAMPYIRVIMKNIERYYPDELYAGFAVMVSTYVGLRKYDSALICGKKSLELLKANPILYNGKSDDSKYAKGQVYLYLGEAFEATANYDSALFYYRLSIPFSDGVNTKIFKIDAMNGIAKCYKEKNDPDSAIGYAKKVLADEISKSYPAGKLKAVNLLADIYQSNNNTDSSLKYLRIAVNLKDSIYNREKTTAFQNSLLKEKEKQNAVEAATSKLQNEYRMYFLIALFVIAIIIAAIVIRNRRIKQLQNMRNNIAADLHDDIGSTLTNISILSELSRQSINPEDNAGKFLTRINEEVNTTSQALDDIIWSVNMHNDSLDEIVFRMRRYSGELFDADGINYKLDFDDKLSGMKISMEQRHDFYLIFKEAVNNIYKHANASYVSVSLCRKDHHIMMRIEDNGKGITEQNLHRNGLKNMKGRAEKWGGDLHIESGKNKGTVLLLLLPAKR